MMSKMALKRPSGKEDEDDILKMQEEFLSAKDAPSAKVQRVAKNGEQYRGKDKKEHVLEKDSSADIVDFTDYTADIPVLLAINEKNVSPESVCAPLKTRPSFPRPFRLEAGAIPKRQMIPKEGTRGPSLFAQQMKKKSAQMAKTDLPLEGARNVEGSPVPGAITSQPSGHEDDGSFSADSHVVDIEDIQKENDARIEAMSLDEIRQYQEQLRKQLGPDIVNFIRMRNKKAKQEPVAMECDSGRKEELPGLGVDVREEKDFCLPPVKKDVPPDLTLPIDPEEARKWPHMDRIEYGKMAWMSQLPPPKPLDPKTGHTARFDFQGFLLAHDEDVPVQQGLHHHGEEPEVAGYTIEEMFHLSRSSLPSQRIIALQSLGKVLHNNNLGLFDECLSTKLLPQLLDAGVIFLLRMALDDSQLDATSAAVYALHELIVSELDEACLDSMFPWIGGHVSPFLVCQEQKKSMSQNESEEMPDTEIVKEDVILGLIRMDILPRLRYILEVMRPNDPIVVKHILSILTRIARHSLQTCVQIYDCPRLMKTVFDNFIPIHWSGSSNSESVYNIPVPSALKLVRCLACAGRHLSKRIICDYHLHQLLNAYIACESSDPNISLVRLEALRTWRVLLLYGLASETWVDLFPVLLKHYQHCQGLSIVGPRHIADLHYTTLLLVSLQGVLSIAATPPSEAVDKVVYWNHVENVYGMVSVLAQKWLHEITLSGFKEVTMGISTITAAINTLATFLQLEMLQPNANTVEICNRISALWTKSIQPFVDSTAFVHLANNLGLYSSLMCVTNPGSERSVLNLPFLGAAQYGGKGITPAMKEGSPLPLFVAVLTFARLADQVHGLPPQSVDQLLRVFTNYTQSVVACKELRWTWFSRQEVCLLYGLVHLITTRAGKDTLQENLILYHRAALLLPSLMCSGESFLTEELFNRVIFHPVFFSEEARLSVQMLLLQTEEPLGLVSATGQPLEVSKGPIVKDMFGSLAGIRSLFLSVVTSLLPQLQNCRSIWKGEHKSVRSLSMEWSTDKRVLPVDWPLLPIQLAYALRTEASRSETEDQQPACSVSDIRFCLLWIHYLMLARKEFLLQSSSAGDLFVNLCSVFLISDDLFLHPELEPILHCLFHRFFRNHKSSHLHLETIQKPLPFLTFYEELAGHFESASYGDPLFASVILVPLQQKYSWFYRQSLLTEHPSALRLLTLPLKQLLVPLEEYLYPLEDQVPLLKMYLKLLLSGLLARCPLFRTIAVHHLHHYVLSEQEKRDSRKLLESVVQNRHNEHMRAVLLYKGVDPLSGVLVESSLPQGRKELLNKHGFCNVDF